MWPPQVPVLRQSSNAASPKRDLNTGVLLKIRKFLLYLYLEWKSSYCIYNKEFSSTSIKSFICTGPFP